MATPKGSIKVLDNGYLQPVCSCGWAGLVLNPHTDLSVTIITAYAEIDAHTHIPKVKKPRKKREKKSAASRG